MDGKPVRATLAAAAVALTLTLTTAAAQQQPPVSLPPEPGGYASNDLPGYALVQRNCLMCHSAEYAATQPPGSPRAYWEATVKKMKKPFGAPYPEADVPAMVDYLVRTYGAERAPAGR